MSGDKDNKVVGLFAGQLGKPESPENDPVTTPKAKTAGGDGTDGTVGERLAKIEGQMESLKRGQDVILGVIGILVIAFVYLVTRVDTLADRVSEMPGKISTDFQEMNRTLSTAITASKQSAPQVLLVPAPRPQPAPKSP